MRVLLRNPRRSVEVTGPKRVQDLLRELGYNRESVIVIRGATLVTGDALLDDSDEIEIRPVVSGGADGADDGDGAGWGRGCRPTRGRRLLGEELGVGAPSGEQADGAGWGRGPVLGEELGVGAPSGERAR